MDVNKITTILNVIATNIPNIDKLKLVKLLYFADKEHLKNWGCFITGDHFKKLPYGPVPSKILDLINFSDNQHWLENNLKPDDVLFLKQNISFDNSTHRKCISLCSPDTKLLSKSELSALDVVIEKYGNLTGSQLIDLTHEEPWWDRVQLQEDVTIREFVMSFPKKLQEEIRKYNSCIQEDNAFWESLSN